MKSNDMTNIQTLAALSIILSLRLSIVCVCMCVCLWWQLFGPSVIHIQYQTVDCTIGQRVGKHMPKHWLDRPIVQPSSLYVFDKRIAIGMSMNDEIILKTFFSTAIRMKWYTQSVCDCQCSAFAYANKYTCNGSNWKTAVPHFAGSHTLYEITQHIQLWDVAATWYACIYETIANIHKSVCSKAWDCLADLCVVDSDFIHTHTHRCHIIIIITITITYKYSFVDSVARWKLAPKSIDAYTTLSVVQLNGFRVYACVRVSHTFVVVVVASKREIPTKDVYIHKYKHIAFHMLLDSLSLLFFSCRRLFVWFGPFNFCPFIRLTIDTAHTYQWSSLSVNFSAQLHF